MTLCFDVLDIYYTGVGAHNRKQIWS